MGLFDHFIQKHKCPVCKHMSKEWQTKDLSPAQLSYKIGSTIPLSYLPTNDDTFRVHDLCDKCRCWMETDVMFNRKTGKILGFACWNAIKQVNELVKL